MSFREFLSYKLFKFDLYLTFKGQYFTKGMYYRMSKDQCIFRVSPYLSNAVLIKEHSVEKTSNSSHFDL